MKNKLLKITNWIGIICGAFSMIIALYQKDYTLANAWFACTTWASLNLFNWSKSIK